MNPIFHRSVAFLTSSCLSMVGLFFTACSSSPSPAEVSDGSADVGLTEHDAGASTDGAVAPDTAVDAALDAMFPSLDASVNFDATFPSPDASVLNIGAGVLTALQENGGPSPTVIILVGCSSNGLVEVAPYSVTESLAVTSYGPFLGSYSHVSSHYSIIVPGLGNSSLIDIEYDTTNQIAGQIAPFAYSSTVTIDPALLTASRPFQAVMFNPAYPMDNTLGYWNSDHLVTCP